MFGTVPARPESRLPTPSAATPPCTSRKFVARGLRQETACTALESPMVSMAPISVTKMNAGSSAQNVGPKLTS